MKMICILPTGEWAEINAENLFRVVAISEERLGLLSDGVIDITDIDEE